MHPVLKSGPIRIDPIHLELPIMMQAKGKIAKKGKGKLQWIP